MRFRNSCAGTQMSGATSPIAMMRPSPKSIRRDGIDILVDLSLHMAHNRLLVFARKPAPLQATWLGYCASTGLETIDYRLSDPYLDPPETDLSVYSEQTLRLPETWWCYGCAGPTPEPSPPPSDRAGYVTFGCLNNFAKVSPGSLDLWAEILNAVPRSRMIIHSYPGSHLDGVRQRFAASGVSADRLEFVAKLPWTQYVQTYGRIDIALDPFPYGGGITTCDALWMGVPVVSLAGQTAVGRGGKSILSNLGLPELVARRPKQYVQTAVTLAQSPARLAELRRTMRHRMLTSPLMNARRFARNVENAYRQMWKQWCLSRETGRNNSNVNPHPGPADNTSVTVCALPEPVAEQSRGRARRHGCPDRCLSFFRPRRPAQLSRPPVQRGRRDVHLHGEACQPWRPRRLRTDRQQIPHSWVDHQPMLANVRLLLAGICAVAIGFGAGWRVSSGAIRRTEYWTIRGAAHRFVRAGLSQF